MASPAEPDLSSHAVLDDQRRRMLRLVGTFCLFGGTPLTFGLAAFQFRAGANYQLVALESLILFAMGVTIREAMPTSLRAAKWTFILGFGTIFVLAFLGYGPLFGVGMLAVAWLFGTVFFTERTLWPSLALVAVVLAVGLAARAGYTARPWPSDDPGILLREVLTTALLAWGSSLLFQRIFSGVALALNRAHEAREMEARATEARETSRRALDEARRLEAIGRLAGGVAHDVNNALTVILGGMEALAVGATEADEVLDDMRQAAEGALATTRQLLTYSRQERQPDESPAQLEALLPALQRNLKRLLPEHVRVVLDIEEGLPPVALGAGRLEQALLNLALNARDAMPNGGELRIRAVCDGVAVKIEVQDDGVGMDEETRARVLDPFFTTKGTGGTGLGLSMVERALREIDGGIQIESTPGEGTSVNLVLPLAERRTEARRLAIRSLKDVHVLVLEDEHAVRRTLVRILRRAGAVVTAAQSVAEAVELLRDDHPFEAFLTDGVLEDGDPLPAIQRFLETGRHAIVIYSGHLESSPVLARITAGKYRFLRKPVAADVLLASLAEEIAQPSFRMAARSRSMPA